MQTGWRSVLDQPRSPTNDVTLPFCFPGQKPPIAPFTHSPTQPSVAGRPPAVLLTAEEQELYRGAHNKAAGVFRQYLALGNHQVGAGGVVLSAIMALDGWASRCSAALITRCS